MKHCQMIRIKPMIHWQMTRIRTNDTLPNVSYKNHFKSTFIYLLNFNQYFIALGMPKTIN